MDGWILYDGACGLCGRWVPAWASTLARAGLGTAPVQDGAMRARTGLDEEALLRDITLVFNDGRVVRGAEVYRTVLRRIWWARGVYLLTVLPGFRALFDLGYRTFARHRYGVSRVCRLEPPASPLGPDTRSS